MRSTGCDWDAAACNNAAERGYLDILRWLRENGCPWDVRAVCRLAASAGHVDVLNFVIEQGEVLSAALLTDALNLAAEYNQLQTAQWLRERGAAWPAVLGYVQFDEEAGRDLRHRWSGAVIAWARAEGCTSPLYD
jgi:hypothetical protein